MTWHLKDRKLEEKIIGIDTDFSRRLNRLCEKWDSNKDNDLCKYKKFSVPFYRGDKLHGEVIFLGDEVESVPEYNPKGWNKFPQVWPPENVRMRVEFQYKNKPEKTYHACFYFFSGKWYWDTCNYSIDPSIGNIRFRPWED